MDGCTDALARKATAVAALGALALAIALVRPDVRPLPASRSPQPSTVPSRVEASTPHRDALAVPVLSDSTANRTEAPAASPIQGRAPVPAQTARRVPAGLRAPTPGSALTTATLPPPRALASLVTPGEPPVLDIRDVGGEAGGWAADVAPATTGGAAVDVAPLEQLLSSPNRPPVIPVVAVDAHLSATPRSGGSHESSRGDWTDVAARGVQRAGIGIQRGVVAIGRAFKRAF